jgi:hypothetical protein
MRATQITTHQEDALNRLIYQYKGKVNLKNLIKDLSTTQIQEIENAAIELYSRLNIDDSEGVQLNKIGEIVGQPRNGLSDTTYRIFLKAKIAVNVSEGDIEQVISVWKLMTGSSIVSLLEAYPAEVDLYYDVPLDDSVKDLAFALIQDVVGAGISVGFIAVFLIGLSFTLDDDVAGDDGEINTLEGLGAALSQGTNTSVSANKLIDVGATFQSDGVDNTMIVYNTTDSKLTAWNEVAPQLNSQIQIRDMVILNNKIYGCTLSGGRLFEWNGTSAWIEVAPQLGSEDSILSMVVLNNKIYGGTAPNGKLYEWNGTSAWIEVAPQLGSETGISSLHVLNNKIYGGTNVNGKLYEWNGTSAWIEVAPQLGSETGIFSLIDLSGIIYGGTSPSGKLYQWNGTSAWVEVAPQLNSQSNINSLIIFNNNIFGGTGSGGRLFKWNGTNAWIEVAPQLGSESRIYSLIVYDNNLYGGTFPSGKLLKWNGTDLWIQVAPQLGSETAIRSLIILNNIVYGGTSPNGKLFKFNISEEVFSNIISVDSEIQLTLQNDIFTATPKEYYVNENIGGQLSYLQAAQ